MNESATFLLFTCLKGLLLVSTEKSNPHSSHALAPPFTANEEAAASFASAGGGVDSHLSRQWRWTLAIEPEHLLVLCIEMLNEIPYVQDKKIFTH